jgi:sugar lactone lactonase YvrE
MNRLLFATCALLLASAFSAPVRAQSVTFAGAQTAVGSGLSGPWGVAVDAAGDLFIADTQSSRVVEIPAGGGPQITIGSGLYRPYGVAVDAAGDVFIADTGNSRVVEVPAGGGAQTTVGSGLSEPYSVAVDGTGDVFIADTGNSRVVEVPAGGGPQTTVGSGLQSAFGVAVDGAGDVFIADYYGNQVVEVPASGGPQTTVGSGLSEPLGVAVDGAGDVFIADNDASQLVEVPAGGGPQTTVGNGLSYPSGVAVDGAGNVFISGTSVTQVVEVQRVAVNFGNVNVCPAGQAGPAPCSQTITLIYNVVATTNFGTINVGTQGVPNLDFTLGSGSTCTGTVSAGSTCTVNVTFAPLAPGARMGAVQPTCSSNQEDEQRARQSPDRVAMQPCGYPSNVLVTTLLRGQGQGPAIAFGPGVQTTVPATGLSSPWGVAVDGAGDVFIVDAGNNRVVEVPVGGGPQTTVPASGLNQPFGVAVDGAGDVFIADEGNNRVVEVPAGGGPQTTVPASGLNGPYGVAVDGVGNVFIADYYNNRVVEVPAGGGAQTTVGSGLSQPFGVAVDGAGDVFIADTNYPPRVLKVPAGGGAQTTVGSGLGSPYGVAVDGAGDVFIADAGNNQVVEVPAGGGAQITVASGLGSPYGVAVDGAGDGFILYPYNDRVVELHRAQPPTLSFAPTAVGSTSSDSPQSVTIQNVGNQPLNAVTPGLAVGPNFLQVAGSGTPADCTSSFSLTPGASCNLSISFAPQSSGNLTAAATFTDNALNASPSASQSIALQGTGLATQTIIFTQSAPAFATYNSSFAIAAAGGASGNAVTFTSSGACSNVGATYTMTSGTGTCSVIANQTGNGNYAAAPTVIQPVRATTASQTITFTQNAPALAPYSTGFTVAASASSGLPVAFSSAGACSNVGATYTMTSGTGTCSVIADQTGNNNYAAALTVTQSVAAVANSQTIAFTQSAPIQAAYNSGFTVVASATSGLPVLFSSAGVCSNVGATYTMTGAAGKCSVIANQSGNDYYLAAPTVTQVTTAEKASQAVTFTGAPATAPYQSSFALEATSNLDITPNITATGDCSISADIVTITSGAGTCTMTAKWTGNSYYLAASAKQTTTAEKIISTITWPAPAAIPYGTPLSAAQLDATANVSGSFTYSEAAGKVLSAGSYTLTATFKPANPTDDTSATASVTLVVNKVDTTAAITSNLPNPSTTGKPVSVHFTVTPATDYKAPTGSVTVSASTGESCKGTLATGSGSCSVIFKTAGPRTLTAAYPGDSNNNPSISAEVAQTVN